MFWIREPTYVTWRTFNLFNAEDQKNEPLRIVIFKQQNYYNYSLCQFSLFLALFNSLAINKVIDKYIEKKINKMLFQLYLLLTLMVLLDSVVHSWGLGQGSGQWTSRVYRYLTHQLQPTNYCTNCWVSWSVL